MDQRNQEVVKIFLIAGGFAAVLIGFGWWLRNKQQGAASVSGLGGLDGPRYLPEQTGGSTTFMLGAPTETRRRFSDPMAVRSSVVSSSPVRIMLRTRVGGDRRVSVSTTQPILVSADPSDLGNQANGLYIDPQQSPVSIGDLPPESELWAIRAGAADAQVGVSTVRVG